MQRETTLDLIAAIQGHLMICLFSRDLVLSLVCIAVFLSSSGYSNYSKLSIDGASTVQTPES